MMPPQPIQPAGSPQFFTVSPQAQPPAKPPINWRKLGLALGGLGVVALLSVAGVNVWRNRPAAVAARQVALDLANRVADCGPDDQSCLATARTTTAQGAGQVSYCDGLEPNAYNTCVTRIARDKKDPAICGSLKAEALDTCKDLAVYELAVQERSLKVCQKAGTNTGIANCEANIKSLAVANLDCGTYGVDAGACEAQARVQAIVASGKPADCSTLGSKEAEMGCRDIFTSTDADGDGLSAAREAELGTLDSKADTDGDGYNDGQEVTGGYNPLGE